MEQKTLSDEAFRHTLHEQIIKLYHSLGLPLYWNKVGPKKFTNYQRAGLIVLFLRSKKSLRDFTLELKESRWTSWLGLKSLPGKSTLHDWQKLFDLKMLRLFQEILLCKEKPSLMAIDATGIDSWQRSRHYEKRMFEGLEPYERLKKMPYAKQDIIIDVDTGLIHDFVLRMKPRHDTLGAKSIFKRMKHKGVKILADRGYDSEPLHKIASQVGNVLYAKLRKMKKGKPGGFYRKKCMIKDPEYNRRPRVESVFNSIKHRRLVALRSKEPHMKKREIAWHILIYNLEIIQRIRTIILWLLKEPFRTSLFYLFLLRNAGQFVAPYRRLQWEGLNRTKKPLL
ncbi:MAG: transposase [bacterium]|nr:transposase [bacterium]